LKVLGRKTTHVFSPLNRTNQGQRTRQNLRQVPTSVIAPGIPPDVRSLFKIPLVSGITNSRLLLNGVNINNI
jgi:hypothetical protein